MKTAADTPPTLGELERTAYRTRYLDGVADLSLGAWLVVFGLLMRTDYAWLGGVLAGVPVFAWKYLQPRIARPRVGQVRFAERRVRSQSRRLVGLRVAFAVTSLIGVALMYLVLAHMELAEAFTIFMTGPIFIAVFGMAMPSK